MLNLGLFLSTKFVFCYCSDKIAQIAEKEYKSFVRISRFKMKNQRGFTE